MAEARKLNELKEDFIRATKRVLSSRDLSKNQATLEAQLDDITNTYNKYIDYSARLWPRLIRQDKLYIKTQLQSVRDKIKLCYDKLNCTYTLPTQLLQTIIPNAVDLTKNESDLESDSEKLKELETIQSVEIENLNDNFGSDNDDLSSSLLLSSEGTPITEINNEIKSNRDIHSETEDNMTHINKVEFLKLAASTVNKTFSGDPLSLQSFVDSIDLLKTFATNDELKTVLTTFTLAKLEGKAREAIIGTPGSVENIIETLKIKIKPDSSKIIEGKIRALRIDKMSLQDFSQKTDELAEAFKRALIIEGIPGNKAEEMTVEKTIEMCRGNARTDLVKSVLASSNFSNHKEVVSKFMVEINTQQTEKQVLTMRTSDGNGRKPFHKNNKKFNNNNRNSNNFRGHNRKNNYRNGNRYPNTNNNNTNSNNNGNNRYNNNGRNGNYRNNNYSDRNNGNGANIRIAGNGDVPQWQLGTSQNQNEQD